MNSVCSWLVAWLWAPRVETASNSTWTRRSCWLDRTEGSQNQSIAGKEQRKKETRRVTVADKFRPPDQRTEQSRVTAGKGRMEQGPRTCERCQ